MGSCWREVRDDVLYCAGLEAADGGTLGWVELLSLVGLSWPTQDDLSGQDLTRMQELAEAHQLQ